MKAADEEPVSGPDPARERIILAATRLFASLSYDGTSIELIAQAAGLDVATISRLVGGKRDIYLRVMRRVYLAENAMYEMAFAEFTPDRAGVHRLTDRYLDFCVDNPLVPALWMHRWQSDAADIAELEADYVLPAVRKALELLRGVVDSDVDLEYALWTIVWATNGFCVGGVINEDGRREGGSNSAFVRRFRAHLHQLIDRMLQLDR